MRLGFVLPLVVCSSAFGQVTQTRTITVKDSIEITKLSVGLLHRELSTSVAGFSPDGKKFVVILQKGNLTTNTNDFSIWLFHTGDLDHLLGPINPERLLTMSSSSNRLAIQNIVWCDDNETLTFQGENPGQLQQVYALNTRTKTLHQLTHHPTNIISFSTTPDARTIAYTAERPAQRLFDDDAQKYGLLITNQVLSNLMAARKGGEYSAEDRIFVQSDSTVKAIDVPSVPTLWPTPFISPDANYVVIATRALKVPYGWSEYSEPRLHGFATEHLDEGQYSRVSYYTLVDVRTKQQRILLNSPLNVYHTVNEVVWSSDSRSVAIGKIYLPLDDASGQNAALLRSTPFTVEVKVADGSYEPVTHDSLYLLRWGAGRNTLMFEGENPVRSRSKTPRTEPECQIAFQRTGSGWTRVADPPPAEHRPIIDRADDINTPPHIVVKDACNRGEKTIFDLNPQFANLRFAKVEQISWAASDGHNADGLLYYPIDYQPWKRYSLVIQTHGFLPARFSMDGLSDWAPFAAQALAAHNIMVLQTGSVDRADQDTIREAPRALAIYEGAIDDLDHKGLIDRNRVGIIGFSRSCLHVKYSLTHSKYHFAAAMVVDGLDGGYFQYIINRSSGFELSREGVNGGAPLGKNLQEWLQRAPGFNTEKVNTPLLIGAPSPRVIQAEWEWLSLLRAQNKPVEMIALEDGEHPVERPWEHRILQEYGTVDWFCFWLNGEEDPEAGKKEKYERWRGLRALQNGGTSISQK